MWCNVIINRSDVTSCASETYSAAIGSRSLLCGLQKYIQAIDMFMVLFVRRSNMNYGLTTGNEGDYIVACLR